MELSEQRPLSHAIPPDHTLLAPHGVCLGDCDREPNTPATPKEAPDGA